MSVRRSRAVRVYTYPADPALAAAGRLEVVRVWEYRSCCYRAELGQAVFVRFASDGGYETLATCPDQGHATTPGYGLLLHSRIDGISDQALTYRDASRPHGMLVRAAAEAIRLALRDIQPIYVSCQRRSGRG